MSLPPQNTLSALPELLQGAIVQWVGSLGKTVDAIVWWKAVEQPEYDKSFTLKITFKAIFTDESSHEKIFQYDVLKKGIHS